MATIKAYTDIEQSRKLAEILSVDSADMCLTFVNNTWNPVWGKADDIYQFQKDCYEPDYTKDDYIDIDEFEPQVAPCWSLVALLSVIAYPTLHKTINGWRCDMYHKKGCISQFGEDSDNPIDACYNLILKLHKLNLL